MSNSSSTKRSAQKLVQEALNIAAKRQEGVSKEVSDTEAFKTLTESNIFAAIMFDPSLTPEQKKEELVKELTFSPEKSKEENRAKLEEFSRLKEYLQEQRKILNKEGIKLQDTEAFAELQSVIDEMTRSSIEFQEKVKPLLEILNAVFDLRKQDKIPDVYKEIQDDKAWLEEKNKSLAELQNELKENQQSVEKLIREKESLSQQRSFFGLGSIKPLARARMNEIDQIDIVNLREASQDLRQKIVDLKNNIEQGPDSDNPELAHQKAILREFLDLSKEENRDRQKALIDAAVNYVETSDTRLKTVLGTLGRLEKHAEVMSDANGMLRNMYVIMDEAVKNVSENHDRLKTTISEPSSIESAIAKITREEKLRELNDHISLVDNGAIDITNSIGGLTKHSVQIQSYKDTLRNESSGTKRLHLEGVSQMGEQLMSVVSAISAAATSESRSVAANNFARMAEQNQAIISQEVVKNATNIEVEANQIAKLVTDLQDYGDILNASSQIASQGYSRMRETVDAIRKVSGHVQNAIQDMVSERADAGIASGDVNETKEVQKDKSASSINPFSNLGTK